MSHTEGKQCHCGEPAFKIIVSQSGFGMKLIPICQSHYEKAVRLATEFKEAANLTWYDIPPTLRPADAFKEEDEARAESLRRAGL